MLEPLDRKNLVLSQMREIYEEAKYVLVLDAELQRPRVHEMERFEIYTRTLHSHWMQRLWTLQERFVAQDLRVRYAGVSLTLDYLRDWEVMSSDVNAHWLLVSTKLRYWGLRNLLGNKDDVK